MGYVLCGAGLKQARVYNLRGAATNALVRICKTTGVDPAAFFRGVLGGSTNNPPWGPGTFPPENFEN